MKRTLFFADLNYINPGREWTIIPFPLNVGYIAAYTQKMLPGAFDIRIFKDQSRFLAAIETEKPDIAAFSNYIWNQNLQLGFARHLKAVYPDCITIMGGPNYNFTEPEWIEAFARANPQIDFHVEGEGEAKFYNIVACALAHDCDATRVKAARPAGAVFVDPASGTLVANDLLPPDGAWNRLDESRMDLARGRLLDLDDVPSPYLTGLFDEFLADPSFCPIVETNRGCPYSCTFCNWGAMGKSKSAMFGMDRVVEELRFIAERNVSTTPYLYIGDANFGLFPRDVEIASLLCELKDGKGFPQNVYMYFAKNSSEKVVRIAEILKDMTPISLSRQTQNDDVLGFIKRSNISIDTFNSLAALAKDLGIDSNVELIYSLPGESKESFYAGVREIAKQNVDGLHMFPAMLLNGSEMGTRASRERFGIEGEWRLIDGCAGSYGPVTSMEFEEIITTTDAMSRADHLEMRLFHFLQALFLDTKIYKDVEVLMGGVSIIDLIQDIISNHPSAPEPFRVLVEEFIRLAGNELIARPPAEIAQLDVERAVRRSVKLNPLFIAKLLYDPGVREAFHEFLARRIAAIGAASPVEITAVLDMVDAMIYPFDGTTDYAVSLEIDAVEFARQPPFEDVRVVDYLLPEPKVYRYHKPFTYMAFVERKDAENSLAERVYEVLVHHTHETFRNTLLARLVEELGEDADARAIVAQENARGRRVIRLEGGWLY